MATPSKLPISSSRFILIEVKAIENTDTLSLANFIEIDDEASKILPASFQDGNHLSLLFALTHNEEIRGERYRPLKEPNEMGLLAFLLENKDIEIDVATIKRMYAILANDEQASFRTENGVITTGEKFYVPASKDNVEKEMARLCEDFKHLNHPSPDDFDDIFKFILQFICIHPFANGNGRMSVFLTELFLIKLGLRSALYLPFDALLNGIYIHLTTQEIRKASGFFYGMKEYDYSSYIAYMKGLLMKSYKALLRAAKSVKSATK